MKLRIRSLESKETLKIQTPSPSSLQDLKDAIAEKISASSENLLVSLNRKDRIDSSPRESLQSLGIFSGDLIFYTLNPNGFSSGNTQIQIQSPQQEIHPIRPIETTEKGETSNFSSNSGLNCGNMEETIVVGSVEGNPNEKTVEKGESSVPSYNSDYVSGGGNEETLILPPEDEIVDDENMKMLVEKTSSIPCYLSKVLKAEVGNIEGDYKLLIVAVHAVLLESGFITFDAKTQKKIDGFHLPEGWASKSGTLSVQYTVPELLDSGNGDTVETVVLKFQTFGKYLNVHGILTQKGKNFHKLCLDKSNFIPAISFVWLNSDSIDKMELDDLSSSDSKSSHETKVFEFWKNAKDGLALPLLIDLCEKTGLSLPPCFVLLPTELKIKILESLPGVDIARTGCVSSELRYLASNNDLWKRKAKEEFNLNTERTLNDYWKGKFAWHWERRRKATRWMQPYRIPPSIIHDPLLVPMRGRRDRNPLGSPFIIGGDHDLFPAPFGSAPMYRFSQRRRSFIPDCNLGGFSG